MERSNNIMVAVDFSPCSAAAMRCAARIAASGNAGLTALHVVEFTPVYVPEMAVPPAVVIPTPPIDELIEQGREQWAAFKRTCEAAAEARFVIDVGNPRDVILEHVRADRPMMLVVGAHSTDDSFRGVGTTSAACAQRAAAPVLVVREEQDKPFGAVAACIEFDDSWRFVLEQAIAVAAAEGSVLRVVHVYRDPWAGLGPPDEIRKNMPDFAERYRKAVEERLRSLCDPMAHELGALKAEFHALQAPSHAEGIIGFVGRHGCDLAVLGTRGRWNMRDFFWGSTAERVVRESPCSVLATKPPSFVQLQPYEPLAACEAAFPRAG